MADQQTFDEPPTDHLEVARNLLSRGNVSESTISLATCHALFDIAESLRMLADRKIE